MAAKAPLTDEERERRHTHRTVNAGIILGSVVEDDLIGAEAERARIIALIQEFTEERSSLEQDDMPVFTRDVMPDLIERILAPVYIPRDTPTTD